MSNKSDLRVVLGIDGEMEFTRKMDKLARQQKELKAETSLAMAALNKDATAYDKAQVKSESLSKQIEIQKQRVQELKNAYERATEQENIDEEVVSRLRTQYLQAESSLKNLEKQLKDANDTLAEHGSRAGQAADKLEDFSKRAKKAGDGLESAGKTLTKGLTVPIMAAGAAAAKSAMEYEDAFAGVKKTVEASEAEYAEMSDSILDMSTKLATSANEIAGVAEAAGQLGISKENVISFSEVMVQLGMSTNLSAEEAASALAKFANITGMSADKYKDLGNVIVKLGNNYATTEADIVSMATRLASTGAVVGYTEPQMMAIATALSSVGIEAEAGGSAFSKLSKQVALAVAEGGKDLEKWARVAGVSSAEFKKAYEEDALGALNMFIKGLNDTSRLGENSISILADMGIKEVRLSNAVLALAGSEDILGKALNDANSEWQNGNALQEEASKRLETTKSKAENAKNELIKTAVKLGDNFLPTIADIAKHVGELADKFGELPPETQKSIAKFALFVASAGPTVTVLGKVTNGIGSVTSAGSKALKTFSQIKAGTYTGPLSNLVKGLSNASGATGELAGASSGLAGLLSSSGPLIVGFGLAAAVAGTMYWAYRQSTEGTRALGEEINNICGKFGQLDDAVASATNLLDGLSDAAVGINAAAKEDVEKQIDDIQKIISDIAQRASLERRDYTQSEIDRLNELFGLMRSLSEQELELAGARQNAAMTMARTETDYSKQNAEDLIKTAQEAKDEVIRLANEQYNEKILLLTQAFENEHSISEEELKNKTDAATAEKNAAVQNAKDKFADTLSVITNGYYDQEFAENEHLQKIIELNEEKKKIEEYYAQESANVAIWDTNSRTALEQAKADALNNINKQISNSFKELNDDEVAELLEMQANTELYGGKVNSKAQSFADAFIACFDGMPRKMKKSATDSVQGMLDGLEEKEPSLFKKASNLAEGFISRIKKKLQIASPSKVTKQLFKFAVQGGEVGVDEEAPELMKSAEALTDDFIKQFEGINPQLSARLQLSAERLSNLNVEGRLAGAKQTADRAINTLSRESGSVTNNSSTTNTEVGGIVGLRIDNVNVNNESDINNLASKVVEQLVDMFSARGVKI